MSSNGGNGSSDKPLIRPAPADLATIPQTLSWPETQVYTCRRYEALELTVVMRSLHGYFWDGGIMESRQCSTLSLLESAALRDNSMHANPKQQHALRTAVLIAISSTVLRLTAAWPAIANIMHIKYARRTCSSGSQRIGIKLFCTSSRNRLLTTPAALPNPCHWLVHVVSMSCQHCGKNHTSK